MELPYNLCPYSPIGRGRRLKISVLPVRVRLRVPIQYILLKDIKCETAIQSFFNRSKEEIRNYNERNFDLRVGNEDSMKDEIKELNSMKKN